MICGFDPIFNQKSKVLVLGSMPSVSSLAQNQYYANPQNAFWKIICSLFYIPFTEDYEQRKQIILNHRLALWDTVKCCNRETSADSKIKNIEPNDLNDLLAQCRDLDTIVFNGKKSFEVFVRFFGKQGEKLMRTPKYLIQMPSTSPANAMLRYEQKLNAWKQLLQYLNPDFSK